MLGLLSPLISGFAAGNIKGVVKRTKIQAVCWTIIAIAAFLAVGFACLLSYLWLAEFVSPLMSATILVGFWLVVALIAFIVMKMLSVKQKRTHKQEMEQERVNLLLSSALAAIPALTAKKKFGIIAAPLVGIAVLALMNSDFMKPDSDE